MKDLIDLTQTTFIIPLKIEHEDRLNNVLCLLNYLNNNIQTNIIILETSNTHIAKLNQKTTPLSKYSNLKIKYLFRARERKFHRTKYLNQMLKQVSTPVVVNYDADVLLEINTYKEAQRLILNDIADFVYPYEWGQFQKNLHIGFAAEFKDSEFKLENIKENYYTIANSEQGHCVYAKTTSYISAGGENEEFISWGPEDKERTFRFKTLGYNVIWMSGHYVYHQDHFRTSDSNTTNPQFQSNNSVFSKILAMTKEQTALYYKNKNFLRL